MMDTDKYHVFGVRGEDREYFLHLIPDEESYSSENGFLMLGAVSEDGEACGVLAYELRDGAYYVRYLYVDPDHRRRGVGTLLLQKMLWSFYQMRQIHPCYIDFTDEDEALAAFMDAQANLMISTSARYRIISPEIRRQLENYDKLISKTTDAVPFFSLDKAQQTGFLDSQLSLGYRFLEADPERKLEYDKNLCFVMRKDDDIRSAIFAGRNEFGNIELIYLYSEKLNSLSIRSVLAAFLQAVEDKYPDESIELYTVNPSSERLISGLLKSADIKSIDILSAEWDYSLEYSEQ